jgi:hypothetical protein
MVGAYAGRRTLIHGVSFLPSRLEELEVVHSLLIRVLQLVAHTFTPAEPRTQCHSRGTQATGRCPERPIRSVPEAKRATNAWPALHMGSGVPEIDVEVGSGCGAKDRSPQGRVGHGHAHV